MGARDTQPRHEAEDCRGEAASLQQRLVLFGLGLLFWLALVWPVAPGAQALQWGEIGAGVLVAALVAAVMRNIMITDFGRLFDPSRYFWALAYVAVFAAYVIRANVDVAYRVLHPAMPIRPGIVKVRSSLKTISARTALANSITLTPGTLTVDMTDDGTFYVHWINVSTLDEREMVERILGRFEWFIARIFE